MSIAPPIDVSKARELAGGNAALARELFSLLRTELWATHVKLSNLDLSAAIGTLGDIAHKLRSSARYCAAPRLEMAAGQAEKLSRAAPAPGLIDQSRKELLLAMEEILGMSDPYT